MADEIERFQSHQAMLEADRIQRIRQQLTGISALFCDDCGAPVLAERRRLIPGVRKCVGYQEVQEIQARHYRRWQ